MAKVSLRPITSEDTANIVRWRNSDSVRVNLYSQGLLTEEQHLNYYEHNIVTGKVFQYVIVAHKDNLTTDIGTVFYKNIDAHSNKAEVGIFIGESAFYGGGYGTAALKQSLNIAFTDLGLNKVYATIMEYNSSSRKIFSKVGFVESGMLIEDYLSQNGYQNIIIVEMTKKMYMEKNVNAGGGGSLLLNNIICYYVLLLREAK